MHSKPSYSDYSHGEREYVRQHALRRTLLLMNLTEDNVANDQGNHQMSERFDYKYQEQELREFIQPVKNSGAGRAVHVVFNNNLKDQGIRGASLFSTLVDEKS